MSRAKRSNGNRRRGKENDFYSSKAALFPSAFCMTLLGHYVDLAPPQTLAII